MKALHFFLMLMRPKHKNILFAEDSPGEQQQILIFLCRCLLFKWRKDKSKTKTTNRVSLRTDPKGLFCCTKQFAREKCAKFIILQSTSNFKASSTKEARSTSPKISAWKSCQHVCLDKYFCLRIHLHWDVNVSTPLADSMMNLLLSWYDVRFARIWST